jgi:MFS family permease
MFDYPTGALGDWIGQKYVLILSFISFGISFLILSFNSNLYSFFIVGFFFGFGNAQKSGCLETWLDNNYQQTAKDIDTDRKIYGFFTSRLESIGMLPSVSSFIIGGIIATLFSRQIVFIIQTILSLFVILIIFLFMNNLSTVNTYESGIEVFPLSFFIGGIKFLFSSKMTFLFIAGLAAQGLVTSIFEYMLLWPIYFAYSGSDFMISIIRTLVWIFIFPISIKIVFINKYLKEKDISKLIGLHALVLYGGWLIIIVLIPIKNEFNLLGFIGIIVVTTVALGIFDTLISILKRQILLDLVPTKNRNAIYSIIPTIISILSIPIIPIVGIIVETYSIIYGLSIALLISLFSVLLMYFSFQFRKTQLINNLS